MTERKTWERKKEEPASNVNFNDKDRDERTRSRHTVLQL